MSTPMVYVGGAGRSGSTLLERMLACIPGFWPVGELVFIWERGLKRNDRCGCGARFRDCEFWTRVGEAGFGGWRHVDVDGAARLHAAVDRHRNLDRIGGLRPAGRLAADMSAYMDLTHRLYEAVREVSGAAVLVDSSKSVGYALMLRNLPGFDLRLIHLVRRSHGVAYSWSRRVRKPGVGDGSSFMSVHTAPWAVGLWITDNLLFDAAARRIPKTTRIRYEDLVAGPRAQLSRIAGELDLPVAADALGFLADGHVQLPASHAISGNPMRFQLGHVILRADEEWRSSMSRRRQAMISLVTWPLLKRYGYSFGSGARPGP